MVKTYQVKYSKVQLTVWTLILFVFALGIIFKINFSSIALWDSYLGGKNALQQGLLAGTPRGIRSDEWMLGVPWVMSQANSMPAFSSENPAVGAKTSALLVGLPTSHWSVIFRPAAWGYFLFDIERAFSWHWMFRTFGLLVLLTIFFRFALSCSIITSLAGACWIFFSGFNQWWLASVSEVIFSFILTCIGFAALFKSNTHKKAILSAIVLLIGSVGFGLTLYPPFQVPLFYLGLSLIPFLLYRESNHDLTARTSRILILVAVIIVTVFFLYLFLAANKETVGVIQSTVYPGQRLSFGGGYNFNRYFSGIFDAIYSEGIYPLPYGNVCEASSFLLFWPVSLLLGLMYGQKKFLLRALPLIGYLFFVTYWTTFGAPPVVAKATFWSMVPSNRALIGLGLGSIIFCILSFNFNRKPNIWVGTLLSLISVLAVIFFISRFDALQPNQLTNSDINYLIMSSSIILVSLIYSSRLLLVIGVLTAVVYPNSTVNPVMSGMDSILQSPLYQAVRSIDQDKSEKWVVFGSPIVPQIVKATGAKVLNGALYAPDLELLKVFDPEQKYTDIYNRYAHVTLNQAVEGQPIKFHLHQADTWQLDISPCDPAFKTLKVRYYVFMPRRKSLKYSCLQTVFKGRNFSIFQRNDF